MSNVVYKFGSKTLRSAEDVRKIVSFIPKINCIAIFSEFDGITPLICELANIANSNDHVNLEKKFNELKSFHTNIIKELHLSDKTLEKEFEELHDILISIKVNNDLDSRLLDSVLIYAEMFSTLIISKYARLPCINSLDIIITDDNYGHANIDEKLSNERFLKLNIPQTIIMAGNIGSDSITGNHTTLGLHGTDYTSAIIAKFFNSSEIVY
jgi:aspartokinase